MKLKLEELTFDIALAKCIAIEQSYTDVEALQGGKSQTQLICYPSQGQTRSLNLGEKLSLQRKSSHPIKSLLSKVASAVWAIMTVKVVRTKVKKCYHCNKTGNLQRARKAKKRERQGIQLIIWTVMTT